MKFLGGIACAGLILACEAPATPRSLAADTTSVYAEIATLSQSGVAAWNRGDLDGYLAPYADSIVVVTPKGTLTTKAELRQLMQGQQAWRGRPPREAGLRNSQFRLLDATHVVQTAEVVLRGGDQPEGGSWLTAIWAHTAAGWRVIHEQSF